MKAIAQKKDGALWPVFDADRKVFANYHGNQIIEIDIIGPQKPRSLAQLAMYFAFCKLTADNTQDEANWGTKEKVDLQCRIACRWIDGWIVVDGVTQVIPRPLNFKDIKHIEACGYISQAYKEMARHLGISVAQLKKMGKDLTP